jgi:hypothetical protein
VEDLDAFWRDNSATAPHEQIINNWLLWASNLQNFVATPTVNSYFNPFALGIRMTGISHGWCEVDDPLASC